MPTHHAFSLLPPCDARPITWLAPFDFTKFAQRDIVLPELTAKSTMITSQFFSDSVLLPALLAAQDLRHVLALHRADVQVLVVRRQLLLHLRSARQVLRMGGQHHHLARRVDLVLQRLEDQLRRVQHLHGRAVREDAAIDLAQVGVRLHVHHHHVIDTDHLEHLRHLGSAAEREGGVLGKVVHTLRVLAVAEERNDARHALSGGAADGADHEDELQKVVVRRSAERLQLDVREGNRTNNVAILSTNALLHLDGDLSVVKATHSAVGNSGS